MNSEVNYYTATQRSDYLSVATDLNSAESYDKCLGMKLLMPPLYYDNKQKWIALYITTSW